MTTVNHHADHPGFAGVTGLLVGLFLNIAGAAVARHHPGCELPA